MKLTTLVTSSGGNAATHIKLQTDAYGSEPTHGLRRGMMTVGLALSTRRRKGAKMLAGVQPVSMLLMLYDVA